MAFDGIVTRAVTRELSEELETGRISKIYQPREMDLCFVIRMQKENKKLFISANPSFPRIHLTEKTFSNPLNPPMFCMLLRKHCEGGIIERIRQVDMERIIHIDIKTRDELGDWKVVRLIVEIMGRHSNIILIDPDRNLILDGIHHVTPAVSRYRTILPGKDYVAPPEQNKASPLDVDREQFIRGMDLNAGKMDKQIVQRFSGISPLIAREILHRAGLPTRENLWREFSQLMHDIKEHRYEPILVHGQEKSYFSVIRLTHVTDGLEPDRIKTFPTVSRLLETYYHERAERDAVRQRVHDLTRFLTNEINKNQKKIKKLEQTMRDAETADKWKLYGELITAYMHQIKKGDKSVRVINYYEEDQPEIDIPLDPEKSPADNAQHYFKKYNKTKTGLKAAREQLTKTREEIDYLEGVLVQLDQATMKEVEDVREELEEQGYLRKRKPGKQDRRKKKEKPVPERFVSSEGIEILVGKNNKQNEYLTNRLASSRDTWLHTKDIPGSHVVIRAEQFGEQTLLEAAELAAYFSKARQSSQVPVDYTLIKHVKKPNGSKPGYVIYDNQKTVYVTPDEATLRRLKKQEA
ncbi:MAG: NFACT family protein [Bacillaceae bacterium]|nr:NFACT family protein [Bacillaceae bacterium]